MDILANADVKKAKLEYVGIQQLMNPLLFVSDAQNNAIWQVSSPASRVGIIPVPQCLFVPAQVRLNKCKSTVPCAFLRPPSDAKGKIVKVNKDDSSPSKKVSKVSFKELLGQHVQQILI